MWKKQSEAVSEGLLLSVWRSLFSGGQTCGDDVPCWRSIAYTKATKNYPDGCRW